MTPVMPTYARAPVAFVAGEGTWLIDEQGERHLDFGAGIAVNCLGHTHPALVAALTDQASRLWHTSNLYRISGQEALAEKLTQTTFADTVFFTNSGAEAMECAIKMARKFHSANGQPERYRIITFRGAFHGRTLATVAAAAEKGKLVDGFGPMPDWYDRVEFGDLDALKTAIGSETAAVMLEPVQGEGGITPFPPEQLRAIRQICDDCGILLIYDEVQCGVGRTGKLFAYEWADALGQPGGAPDIMGVAKGIGGGFPMGACLATADAASGMIAGTHGSTYGGNPLAMAVGQAVLKEILSEGFLDDVNRKAGFFRQRLEGLVAEFPDLLDSVRGSGLMIGLKSRGPVGAFIDAARAEKLLTVPAADNVMRILPPLNVSDEEIRDAMNRLECALTTMRKALST